MKPTMLLLALLLLGLPARPAHGHSQEPIPKDRTVRSATVVAIARVKAFRTTRPRCQVVTDVELEVQSYLKGGPLKDKRLREQRVDHTWNPAEKCPSVSYTFAPRAQLADGIDVVVTLAPWGSPPTLQVTGTFDLTLVPQIRQWLAEKVPPPPKQPPVTY